MPPIYILPMMELWPVSSYLTSRSFALIGRRHRGKRYLTLRKPWTEWVTEIDENKKEVNAATNYFRLKDLHAYLIRNKFTHYSNTGQIIAELRKVNGVSRFWKLNGTGVNTWGVPAFETPIAEHEIQEQNVIPF